MRNALAHAGRQGRRVVSAFIGTAFVRDDAEAAKTQWRQVADQLRPKVPKLAALMDEAENGAQTSLASSPMKSRVEDGRGSLGHAATLRFPSPLIEPDVPISGIRLSDWLHREAHGESSGRKRRLRGGFLSFALRYSFL